MEKTKTTVSVDRIHILEGEGTTRAFCDIKILDSFVLKGLRVVNGKEGLFVSMPRNQGRDGKWYENFIPLSPETRKDLQDIVLEEYEKLV